jgi:protocatechuate 3,4-dioxygenase beta subunit
MNSATHLLVRHAISASRRDFLRKMALGTALFTTSGAFAEELIRTPQQTEGPFYPDKLPLDTDNDLIVINDSTNPGVGQITYLSGRVLDSKGTPVRNALVEIWQADNNGAYLHTRSGNGEKRDGHYQGFGRFLTGSKGEYLFRTIKPVPYPGRTPHIHVKVKIKGSEEFCTQCYIKGEPKNDNDGVLRAVKDEKARNSLIIPFDAIPGSKINELAATFDIVLGFTPQQA